MNLNRFNSRNKSVLCLVRDIAAPMRVCARFQLSHQGEAGSALTGRYWDGLFDALMTTTVLIC